MQFISDKNKVWVMSDYFLHWNELIDDVCDLESLKDEKGVLTICLISRGGARFIVVFENYLSYRKMDEGMR